MPLVVPILRLVMLFLNIYDSYKTLKTPPPSQRNNGRPSQRAVSQRKRDLKGCLAVWIVWCCFVTYEGAAEALVSLFVPFYDEFKSLLLMFLILTRARGAEPIFLHLIRPILKPYTPTMDMFLDFFRMLGDMFFLVATIPIQMTLTWWRSSMFYSDEVLESESEGVPEPRADPVSQVAAEQETRTLHFPKKVSSQRQLGQKRVPSGERSRGPSRKNTPIPDDNTAQGVPSNGTAERLRTHEIWYPSPASYSDAEEDTGNTTSGLPAVQTDPPFLLSGEPKEDPEEVDDWRQYPPFPSAYPPTPIIASSSGLPSTTTVPPSLSRIFEDPQQDFRGSLLPPRKPLNPGFVDGLSDEFFNSGVQNHLSDNMSVSSDSEEDEFNVTLKTPMAPLRPAQSRVGAALQITREASMASSIASRSTTLSTAHHTSLKTQSSSDSLSSGAISISDLGSVLGKKRPLPLDKTVDVKGRVQAMEGRSAGIRSRESSNSRTRQPLRTHAVPRSKRMQSPSEIIDEDTASSSFSDDTDEASASERKPPYPKSPKRRKVAVPPGRSQRSVQPIRPRVTRYATAPTRAMPNVELPNVRPASSRASARLHPGPAGRDADGIPSNPSQANLSSINNIDGPATGRTTRLKERNAMKTK